MKEVPLSEAKARLSSVIDDARQGEATVITRHGKKEAVVVAFERWSDLTSSATVWDLLTNAPVDGRDLTRSRTKTRDFDF